MNDFPFPLLSNTEASAPAGQLQAVFSDPVPADGAWVLEQLSCAIRPEQSTHFDIYHRHASGIDTLITTIHFGPGFGVIFLVERQLLAGDRVWFSNWATQEPEILTLGLFGTVGFLNQIPPPPVIGVWCEPFPPTNSDDADQLYTAHLDRMDVLSARY